MERPLIITIISLIFFFHTIYWYLNRVVRVMVGFNSSSAPDRGFNPRLGQTINNMKLLGIMIMCTRGTTCWFLFQWSSIIKFNSVCWFSKETDTGISPKANSFSRLHSWTITPPGVKQQLPTHHIIILNCLTVWVVQWEEVLE